MTAARTRAEIRAAATRALDAARVVDDHAKLLAEHAAEAARVAACPHTRPEHCDHVPLAEMARRLAGYRSLYVSSVDALADAVEAL